MWAIMVSRCFILLDNIKRIYLVKIKQPLHTEAGLFLIGRFKTYRPKADRMSVAIFVCPAGDG